jgi:HK97 family phage major capsid protein
MKLFKVIKAFGSHAVGTGIELDPESDNTKGLVLAGLIEEDSGLLDSAIAKAIEQLTKSLQPAFDSVAAKTLEAVTANIKSKGPQIEPVQGELDKKKSLGHQLVQVGILGSDDAPPQAKQKAAETLKNLYLSEYRDFGDTSKAYVYKASGTMVDNSGPNGGYGVFPEYSAEIYRLAIEDTILAMRARRRPMTSNELRYPKLDQTGTQATGQTGILGGVVAGWANETKQGNQTQAKLKQGVLKAGELIGYTVVSNELLSDNGVGLEALLSELFVEAISYYTDLATLVGDGVDKPTGVSNSPAAITVNRGTSNTFVYNDAVNMKSKLLSKSEQTAFWVFNKTVQPQLYNMVDGTGRNIWLANFPGGDNGPVAGLGSSKTFLDLPYFLTEKTPALGTTADVMLIDPLGYMIGDRMSLEIAASPHVNFLSREMTYRFVARVAGQALLDKPYTMLDGAHTLSTFSILN